MADPRLCIDCHECSSKPGRTRCQPCCWVREKPGRDVQRRQAKEREYKRRLRARRGCRTREQIKADAVVRAERLAFERAQRAPRPRRATTRPFTTTDTLRKPLVERARNVVYFAVREGRLAKPTRCPRCGQDVQRHRMHAHHHDHAKPLDIQWLCSTCHAEVDPTYSRQLRARRGSDYTEVGV